MKIAVISDIHDNLFALEAVLAHAESLGVKRFWCLGDYVHFNAYPQEVIKTIRKLDLVSIHGNIDRAVLSVKDKKLEEMTDNEKLLSWTNQRLSKKSIRFLADLPDSLPVKLKGYRFLLTHGSPVALDDPIYTDTPDDRLRELSAMTRADVILCGHTHKPFIREVDNRIFINPGSVGKPIDGDPRASYCVLTVKKGSLTIDHYRIEYEVEKAIEAMRQTDLPELYIRTIELSMPFDKVQPMLEVKTPEAA